MRWQVATLLAAVVALALTTGVAVAGQQSHKAGITITALIGSSGPGGDIRRQQRRTAWSKQTGNTAKVVVASDLGQQLAQGFASGNPADIFYLGNDQVATYAKAGDLAPLDNLKNVKSFYPSLKSAYTYKGHLYAAPKDFSTLALVINTASWKGAKLTNADLPKTWKQLAAVAKKLTRNGSGRPLHRPRVPPARRLHDSRPAAGSSPRTARPPRSTARRTSRRSPSSSR